MMGVEHWILIVADWLFSPAPLFIIRNFLTTRSTKFFTKITRFNHGGEGVCHRVMGIEHWILSIENWVFSSTSLFIIPCYLFEIFWPQSWRSLSQSEESWALNIDCWILSISAFAFLFRNSLNHNLQ